MSLLFSEFQHFDRLFEMNHPEQIMRSQAILSAFHFT